eukprot:SAG25_NODE_1303_length_3350_cov_5.169904_1_plen_153_part_00
MARRAGVKTGVGTRYQRESARLAGSEALRGWINTGSSLGRRCLVRAHSSASWRLLISAAAHRVRPVRAGCSFRAHQGFWLRDERSVGPFPAGSKQQPPSQPHQARSIGPSEFSSPAGKGLRSPCCRILLGNLCSFQSLSWRDARFPVYTEIY